VPVFGQYFIERMKVTEVVMNRNEAIFPKQD
jgi:hypothetical protein